MTKIVITGGAGFIGSHLTDRLAQNSANEIIIVDNFYRGKRENLVQHADNPAVHIHDIDIRDYPALESICQGADTIYHLAAQSNVMGSIDNVDYSFSTNVAGTVNVLKAARANGVRRTVFTSSREVYGEAQYTPVDENHPKESKNSYGASKAAGELYCNVFYNDFGVETAILRLGNVYGTRDFGRVIPLWLGHAQSGTDLIVFGGKQLIDFVSIPQTVEALIRASTAENIIGTPINIGSGVGTPILELAERILSLTQSGSKLDLQPARSVEVVKFVAQIDRMKALLDLCPPSDPLTHLADMV